MRITIPLGAAFLIVAVAGCQSAASTAPVVDQPAVVQQGTPLAVSANAAPNACAGQIVAGIASTWPWAHDSRVAFPPPPGSIALWVELFGPSVGISSVQELQDLFCSPS
jgi:hypothetical protein